MKAWVLIVLSFAGADSFAAELLAQRHDNHLGARIEDITFPDSFRGDLTSGLTNRLMIRLTVHQGTQELHSRSVEIAIRYDLWDEQFTMTTQLEGNDLEISVYRDVQQVIQRLQTIQLPTLFSTKSVPANAELIMQAVVLLNPIDRERMDAIKEWVAKNSRRSSLDPAAAMGVGDISMSNAIFNRIFEQYASGSDVASAWHEKLTSAPFRVDTLPHESR